jgi:hypothetical protein
MTSMATYLRERRIFTNFHNTYFIFSRSSVSTLYLTCFTNSPLDNFRNEGNAQQNKNPRLKNKRGFR